MSRKAFQQIIQEASKHPQPRGFELAKTVATPKQIPKAETSALQMAPFGAIPFGEDYKHLNKLAFYTQECQRVEKENPSDP